MAQQVPIKMMSFSDMVNIKHILEGLHEKESYYNSGIVLLRPEEGIQLYPHFDINNIIKKTKISYREYQLVNDLKLKGSYTSYSTFHEKQITVGKYFEKYDLNYGTTAREVFENVWKKIDSGKGDIVHEYGYSSDNMENFSNNLNHINLTNLVESSLLGQFDEETKKIEGIFTPFAYYGVTVSIGGTHVEDSDLMSLNVHLWGSIKHWISVCESYREEVIKLMAKSDKSFKEHPHHYRCKMMILSPRLLIEKGIPIHEAYQQKNDIIATLCGAFHQVTNCGKNICLASQYAPHHWLEKGLKSGVCNCNPNPTGPPMPKLDLIQFEQDYNPLVPRKVELKQVNRKLFCSKCAFEAEFPSLFARHTCWTEKERLLSCLACEAKFRSTYELRSHEICAHGGVRGSACPLKCGTIVKDVKRHLREMHGDKKYICKRCGKSFSQSHGLSHHLKKLKPCSSTN